MREKKKPWHTRGLCEAWLPNKCEQKREGGGKKEKEKKFKTDTCYTDERALVKKGGSQMDHVRCVPDTTKWILNKSALKSKCVRMPVNRPTSFDSTEWQLSERTVEISDAPSERGRRTATTAAAVAATEGTDALEVPCGPLLWLSEHTLFSSTFDSDHERVYRPRINIVTKALLRTVCVLMLAWQIGMTLFMAIDGDYDLSMFTFWNYTMTTVLVAFLTASLFYERILLTFTLLFLFPVVFGDNAVVRFGIVVIVGRNADVFLGDGSQSVETRYVGDFIVHSLPLGMLLVVMLTGLLLYVRRALGYELGLFRTSTRWWLYVAYWILSPLIPLAIYTASFSIAQKYPTGIPTGLLWLALVGVDIVWMGFFLLIFVAVAKFSVQFTSFWVHRQQEISSASAPQKQPLSGRLSV